VYRRAQGMGKQHRKHGGQGSREGRKSPVTETTEEGRDGKKGGGIASGCQGGITCLCHRRAL